MDLFGQTASSNNNNPLNQNLILRLVLEHVGKANVTDLKNCRLVNHSWNCVAVQVLEEQHGYALELNLKNLDEFENVLWRTQLSRINQDHQELASLRLNIKLCSLIRTFELETVGRFCAMGKAGRMLQLNSQLRVASIAYTCDVSKAQKAGDEEQPPMILLNQELFNLLRLTSTTLESIVISYADMVFRPHFEEFEFNSSLTFPTLTFLEYKINIIHEEIGGDEMRDLTKHVVSIIHGAPKLTKLSLYLWDGHLKRTTNSLHAIMKGCADRLEELELEVSLEAKELDVFKTLSSEIKFPALRLITIIDGLYFGNEWFTLFLKNNCPALQEIQIKWDFTLYYNEENSMEEPVQMLLEFPTLPNILAFSLDLVYSTLPDYLERVHTCFSTLMKGLPSLKSLNLSLTVLFMLGAHLKKSGHLVPSPIIYPVFPNISTMEINISYDDDETIDLFNMTTVVYHHTFPNLRKLVIRPASCSSSVERVSRVDLEIEFLCRHPGIQILEIRNYAKPWLGQLFSIGNQSLEGLKHLKLFAPETGAGPRLDPVQLVTRFPALESIQFGKKMISTTQIRSLRDVLKIFEDPISK